MPGFPPSTTATARPNVPEWGGTPRSARTPSKNALFTKKNYHSTSGRYFSIFARSLLLPTPIERRDQMCQVFGLAETRAARKPGTFAPSLLAPQQTARPNVPEWGEPRDRPPIKKALSTKRIYHSTSGPDFSIFARSLFLPTPNERRDQMCQVFGLTRSRGARKPGTFAPSLLAPQQTARPNVPEWGEPRDRTPIKNALFTKRNYHSKSGPGFSIFARSLLLPTPNERRDQMCQVSLPAPQQRQGQMCRNGGEPRDRPGPQAKTHFLRKKIITQHLAVIFQFLPAPSSSLHPLNGETRCARFLGSPKPAQPENLAHLLLPSLHHSKRQGQMCRNGENPEIGPQSKKHFLRKEFITQHLALIFQFLPAPSSSLHPMNGETKCARFLGSPGPAEPENLAHLLLPSLHHSNGKAKCAGMSNQKRNFYEKNLSLKIWP